MIKVFIEIAGLSFPCTISKIVSESFMALNDFKVWFQKLLQGNNPAFL
jgi:hypothetical protein